MLLLSKLYVFSGLIIGIWALVAKIIKRSRHSDYRPLIEFAVIWFFVLLTVDITPTAFSGIQLSGWLSTVIFTTAIALLNESCRAYFLTMAGIELFEICELLPPAALYAVVVAGCAWYVAIYSAAAFVAPWLMISGDFFGLPVMLTILSALSVRYDRSAQRSRY